MFKKINWKIRYKNKAFWLALIPAVLIFIQIFLSIFNIKIDIGDLTDKLIALVNAAFAILAIIGIVNDPTTEGYSDSTLAMSYEVPKVDTEKSKEEVIQEIQEEIAEETTEAKEEN